MDRLDADCEKLELLVPPERQYLIDQPVWCRIRLRDTNFAVESRDWIGLYAAPLNDFSKYLTFEWATTAKAVAGTDSDDEGEVERIVHFMRRHLPTEDTDALFMFGYIRNDHIIAVSLTFQFRNFQALPPNVTEVKHNTSLSASFVAYDRTTSLTKNPLQQALPILPSAAMRTSPPSPVAYDRTTSLTKNPPQQALPILPSAAMRTSPPSPVLRPEVLNQAYSMHSDESTTQSTTTSSFEILNYDSGSLVSFPGNSEVGGDNADATTDMLEQQNTTMDDASASTSFTSDVPTAMERLHIFSAHSDDREHEDQVAERPGHEGPIELTAQGPTSQQPTPADIYPTPPPSSDGTPACIDHSTQTLAESPATVSEIDQSNTATPVVDKRQSTPAPVVSAHMTTSNLDLPNATGVSLQHPDIVLSSSFFTEVMHYEVIQKYVMRMVDELKRTNKAYQRERGAAMQAMEKGQKHKETADSLVEKMAVKGEALRSMEARLAQGDEALLKLEKELQEKTTMINRLQQNKTELHDSKEHLKKGIRKRDDELRRLREEQAELSSQLSSCREQIQRVEAIVREHLQKMSGPRSGLGVSRSGDSFYADVSSVPQNRSGKSLASTIQDILERMTVQQQRQNEALITLEEERIRQLRQTEQEQRDLVVQAQEHRERAMRAEDVEAENVQTIERLSQRLREMKKENDTLRGRIAEATSFGQPIGAAPRMGSNPVVFEADYADITRYQSQNYQSAPQHGVAAPLSAPRDRSSPNSSSIGPAPQKQSLLTTQDLDPDPEVPPPVGIVCPVCNKSSDMYVTMRMWQWHVNGHFT